MKKVRKISILFLSFIVVQFNLLANDKVVDSLSQLLKSAELDSTRIDLHAQLSNLLLASDYKQSLMHATSAVRLAEKTDDYARKIKSYKVAGAVCMYVGLNDLSVNYYTKFYKLAESKNDQTEMGAANFNLASVQMALNNYPKAKDALLKAGDLLNEAYKQKGQLLPDPILLMYRMNLSIIYTNLGELKRSDSILSLIIPMVKGVKGLEDKLQNVYHIQCQLFISKKEFDKALAAIKDARTIANQRGDIAGQTATYVSSGLIYQEKGDTVSAIKEYSQGYRIADAIGGIALQGIFAESLYKLYQKSGNADSSIKYFDLFTAFKEKSKNDDAKAKLMREELLQEYKKLEGDLQQKTRSEKRTFIYMGIVALMFAFVGIFGTIRYRRSNRRLELEQARKDLESKRIEMEKERLELQVADKDKQLSELEYRLSKNTMLETLVTELQSVYAPDGKGTVSNTKKQDTSKLVQQGKIWEEFEVRFAKTHGDFYDRLVKAFPDITLNERRLCAFLKLDMTTKEISTITGQSVRAIEIARTRLRKKLNLNQSDTSLFEFLSRI